MREGGLEHRPAGWYVLALGRRLAVERARDLRVRRGVDRPREGDTRFSKAVRRGVVPQRARDQGRRGGVRGGVIEERSQEGGEGGDRARQGEEMIRLAQKISGSRKLTTKRQP